jgi:diaminopimelate decarboxylase
MPANMLPMPGSPELAWKTPSELAKLDTPCYVFDAATVESDYSDLKRALGTSLVVSLKANPNADLFVRCAHTFVDGIELASQGELNVVVGRSPVPKFINTPAMDQTLMSAGIASRATLILDSLSQVEMLASLSPKAKPLPVMLRLNAAGLVGNVAQLGGGDHFGMDVHDAMKAIIRLRAIAVGVRGLHVFAGSHSFKVWSPLIRTAMEQLVPAVEAAAGAPLELVNVGGGFPEDWRAQPALFDEYRRSLNSLSSRVKVYHESGRGVFNGCGHFVTKVIAVKSSNGGHAVICDGGIAQCFMLAQTERVIKRLRRPVVVPMRDVSAAPPGSRGVALPATVAPAALSGQVRVVGNSCSRADVVGELDSSIPVRPGDRLIFADCGAYTTYSPTGFLNLKAPNLYLVS